MSNWIKHNGTYIQSTDYSCSIIVKIAEGKWSLAVRIDDGDFSDTVFFKTLKEAQEAGYRDPNLYGGSNET